jgi:hypothetical protein
MIGEASIGEQVIGGESQPSLATIIDKWAGVLEIEAEEER